MSDRASARRIAFVLPGTLDGLTGGTIYDRRIVAGLRQRGWQVDVVALSTQFPWPGAAALDDAAAAVAAIPDGTLVVADGLAFGAMPAVAHRHAARLRWIALVHHPLALETGLGESRRSRLFDSERQALAAARGVIVTSTATARELGSYGVAARLVRVVEPGTTPAALAAGTRGPDGTEPLSLLCVATLTPRKGHGLLLHALLGAVDDIVGRSPARAERRQFAAGSGCSLERPADQNTNPIGRISRLTAGSLRNVGSSD